jgi:hypothetical protein
MLERSERDQSQAACDQFAKEARQALYRLKSKGWPNPTELKITKGGWTGEVTRFRAGWKVGHEVSGDTVNYFFLLTNGKLQVNLNPHPVNFAVLNHRVQLMIISNVQLLGT